MGALYVIATPIGNLEDISLRALRVLKEVPLLLAEDTRTAGVLLRHYGITTRLLSYNDHNKSRRIPEIIGILADSDIGLVSDAGTPGISDPGVDLVAAVRAAGYAVIAIPGPSAPIAALSVAGLRTRSFRFVGFLPRQDGPLRSLLRSLVSDTDTVVAFESAQRLRKTLQALSDTLPDRRIAVCRELTKLHEEVFVGHPDEALGRFETARGEVVLVIEGASKAPERLDEAGEAALRGEIAVMREVGLTRTQAAALTMARHGVSRRRFYALWLESATEAETKRPRRGSRPG